MHNSFFFLKQLSKYLSGIIKGWTVSSCFSQNKNELIISLKNKTADFHIKADLNTQFSCLSFQQKYSRARKNSVDLFPEIIGEKVNEIIQYEYERAFLIKLSNDYSLLFKLFGNFSNIILYKGEKCISIFKTKLKEDLELSLNQLGNLSPFSKFTFEKQNGVISELSPVFDRHFLRHIQKSGYDKMTLDKKWVTFSNLLKYLENPSYYIYEDKIGTKLSLFKEDNIVEENHNPIEAINNFYFRFQKQKWLVQEKNNISGQIKQQIKKTKNYLDKTLHKLEGIENATDVKQLGDIIMANLNEIKTGQADTRLFNFYNNQTIDIKLNPRLSPQKNAENYYRKSKNRQIEITKLKENLKGKRLLFETMQEQLEVINGFTDLKDLRQYLVKHGFLKKNKANDIELPSYKEYTFLSYKILVGRNAKNNDQLTFREGYKEDLWLHARDVTGSHVLIKYQAGKVFPKPVIEKAAEIAAYFSKNKNNSICPVIYTPRKFVRKSKGLPAGAVIVDKEEVILVSPSIDL